MGVNNARILDIHYPDRNIAALLLHNDYAADFQKLLESKRVHFVNNFDPWDGSILKDPQYLEMTNQDRSLRLLNFNNNVYKEQSIILENLSNMLSHTISTDNNGFLKNSLINLTPPAMVNQQTFSISMTWMLFQTTTATVSETNCEF
jgi:nitrate/nitrite-specific signal transduction histidine kinase